MTQENYSNNYNPLQMGSITFTPSMLTKVPTNINPLIHMPPLGPDPYGPSDYGGQSLDDIVESIRRCGVSESPPKSDETTQEHASSFLEEAVATMKARAALRDAGESGERSMARTVDIFRAWTGHDLSTQDGWRFMVALKMAREIQGFYNKDDYVDLAAYCGLLGEEESGNKERHKP